MPLRIIVRSKRDADAVKSSIGRFPETRHAEVISLGGARRNRLVSQALSVIEPYSIVLLGREDKDVYDTLTIEASRVPFVAVILARTKKVRNSTVEMINALITRGRAIIRLATSWTGEAYKLSRVYGYEEVPVPIHPASDSFFIYGRGFQRALRVMGVGGDVPDKAVLLAVKLEAGRHVVFSGPRELGKVFMYDYGPSPRGEWTGTPPIRVPESLESVASANADLVETLEEYAVKDLENAPPADTVVVPVSGGKDSAATLVLATKFFGPEKVRAVYVDTGIDFPENREYVEELTANLGVELAVEHAGVDTGLLQEGLPLPAPEYRWCTGRKLAALNRAIRKVSRGRTLLVVGDRDAESERRSRRPLVRVDSSLPYPTISPIRLWSGAHVLAYLYSRGITPSRLYEDGFYRTGCYLCFSLRTWELMIMEDEGYIERILSLKPEHGRLLRAFLELKRRSRRG